MPSIDKQLPTKYDPLQIFAGSTTPAGLYARQKWRREEGLDAWRRDFQSRVKELRGGQLNNGSWNNSEIDTIQKLFGLHLTVRDPDEAIEGALDWLLSEDKLRDFMWVPHRAPDEMYDDTTNSIDKTLFYNLPFINGCFGHFAICASLFLASCFGMGEQKRILKLYDAIAGKIEAKGGHWCSVGCTNNAMRAFAVHGYYSKSKSTAMMVRYLGCSQLASGKWQGQTPLYITFNALAHLDFQDARFQCHKAARAILKAQNKDGSWGRTQKEWNTFLVVHTLNRLNV